MVALLVEFLDDQIYLAGLYSPHSTSGASTQVKTG